MTFQFEESVCGHAHGSTHTRTHKWLSGSADSFLKVIIKDDCVSQPDLPSDPNRPLLTGVTSGS